ncbi:MAG: sigma-70 family RNA polymerase sigma factor [Lachnospiraceae bacterium]|nr:sigma-70 family RNA polymerase sigma factor [Lachnospiraceae bacterium]
MEKQEILKRIDEELIDKLMGFSYVRTRDSYEAEELCSDILYAIIKSSQKEGEIKEFYAFIWRVAKNVYADFSERKSRMATKIYEGDPEEVFKELILPEEDDELEEISRIVGAISFLTKAYRDVMIMYYFEQMSSATIAKVLNISETSVRQRLFYARESIRKEVLNMNDVMKPVVFDKIEYEIIGTGDPSWGDPRDVCSRQLSKHIVWMCHKKPKTAKEISDELHIPMPYVEEELEILSKGANNEYGLLKDMGNGKFGINFALFDTNQVSKLHKVYEEKISEVANAIMSHFDKYKDEYMSKPYLNHKVPFEYIIWQNCMDIIFRFGNRIVEAIGKKHFLNVDKVDRPFSVFGYVDNGKDYGCGDDRISAENICGYKKVWFENIYITNVNIHFHCGHDIANDKQMQWAIKAIEGIDVKDIPKDSKEDIAKAIECGYLYRENDKIYTKILVLDVSGINDEEELYNINSKCFENSQEMIDEMADEIGALLKQMLPEYLYSEYAYGNNVAGLPLIDGVFNELIKHNYISAPKNGIGAEGCWMFVDND